MSRSNFHKKRHRLQQTLRSMLSSKFSAVKCALSKSVGAMGSMAVRTKYTLPDLPYDYNALEPYISADIMKLHHMKHHQTYVNNLNVAEDKLEEAIQKEDVNAIIQLQSAIKFNGGGHLNHSIFWETLSPKGGGEPDGALKDMILQEFGTFDALKKAMTEASVGVQGSGWGWLGFDKAAHSLRIVTCANQDPLQATTGLVPLFGIDVWEHAYYLQYKNVRPDYVNAIWNIVNWKNVTERFKAAL
ncbi:superoxide dismutase [Mn], mitochondrial-like isoform X2 [Ostrea edulis]|uniref:superoxide dismutase [Mn], mitochondrial-like isoform X2 n=1 Tax=Ostrea edulis TaxID=37623 RepID=UPI0020961D08|nr:superoxide dismutase [Mn], mitochondrial-like isoform X2 [Ostrea edulis]